MLAREKPTRLFPQFPCVRLLLCGLIAAAICPALAAAQQLPDELLQAWRRRQELVKTARFQFATDVETRQSPNTPLVSHRQPEVFILDGKKWRRDTQTLEGREIVSTFDGRQVMGMSEGRVSIPANSDNDHLRDVQLQPIVQWLRPLVPSYHGNVDLSDCELLGTDEIVDGQPCLKLRAPAEAGGDLVLFLFVDPSRDFVVLRLLSEVNERRSILIDISYTEDSAVGWVPSAWKAVWYHERGEVGSRYSSHVADYAINKPLSEKLFVIDLRPGTLVQDHAANISYLVGGDGEKTLIPPPKLPKPPVPKQPTVPAPSADDLKEVEAWNRQMMRGTLFVAIGALVALGVAALWRGRRQSA